MKLYKTTIVIWSEDNPDNMRIEELAYEATEGDYYCSKRNSVLVEDSEKDPDWDGTDFFEDEVEICCRDQW